MNRPPARSPYRPPRRTAPPGRRSAGRPLTSGRLARPGRPLQRTTTTPRWLFPALGLLLALALYGGYTFWRAGQAKPEVEPNALAAVVPTPGSRSSPAPTVTATPTSLPTPTRAVVVAGSVPGAPATPTGASQPGRVPSIVVAPTPEPVTAEEATDASVAPTVVSPNGPDGFDQAALQKRMLELVNKDRQANGLRPLDWDAVAATAGQKHAEEMAGLGYMSHWNIDGYGPEHRYSQAGGLDSAQENVYRLIHRWEDGSGAPITDWDQVAREAETALMNSPGHRANILKAEHTGLGVGISYRPESGTVAIAQEFTNHYVTRDPVPQRARLGDRIVVRGKLLPGSQAPLLNIGYEPFPKPMTLEELNNTGTYTPRATSITVPATRVDDDGLFVAEHVLDRGGQPGLYHVLVWVNSPSAEDKVLAVDAVIDVR